MRSASGLGMDFALATCPLSPAVRPVFGPVDVCQCCGCCEDDDVCAVNICVACGRGPMCGACTWNIPYLCCRCHGQSEHLQRILPCMTILAVRRSVYVREVVRILTLHPSFRAAWYYIARSGVRMASWYHSTDFIHPSRPHNWLPLYRPLWELVQFYQWSLRVLRACTQPDSALYIVTCWMGARAG